MLSRKELLFLSCLRRSARKNLTTIAREVGIPVSTLFERLRRLESSHIMRHTTLLNFDALGYGTRAKLLIGVRKKDKEALRNFLSRSGYVNSVFKITNGYDFMVEAVFSSMGEVEQFWENMEDKFSITRKSVHFIIEDVEREKFLSDRKFLQPNKKNFLKNK